jgi:hypothetical protein
MSNVRSVLLSRGLAFCIALLGVLNIRALRTYLDGRSWLFRLAMDHEPSLLGVESIELR